MGIATWVGAGWIAVSVPVSILLGFVLRGDDRELIAVEGGAGVYLMPDGTVSRAPMSVAA